jgi:hypothetical protein
VMELQSELRRRNWPRGRWLADPHRRHRVRLLVGLLRLRPGSLLWVPAPCSVSCNLAEAFGLAAGSVGDAQLPTGLAKARQEELG